MSETNKDLRKASYAALNWAARKSAENMEQLLSEKVKAAIEERDRVWDLACADALYYEGLKQLAMVWELRRRIVQEYPKAGIELIIDRVLNDIANSFEPMLDELGRLKSLPEGASFVSEFEAALKDGDLAANHLWKQFRYGFTWKEERIISERGA